MSGEQDDSKDDSFRSVVRSAWVETKMERDRIPHAPLATGQEFLRRVMLDLTGTIPTPTEVREFLATFATSPSG